MMGGGWMWLFGLLTLAGVVLVVIVAVRAFGGGISHPTPPGDPASGKASSRSRARQILDERYARGALTTDEYQERLRTLDET